MGYTVVIFRTAIREAHGAKTSWRLSLEASFFVHSDEAESR